MLSGHRNGRWRLYVAAALAVAFLGCQGKGSPGAEEATSRGGAAAAPARGEEQPPERSSSVQLPGIESFDATRAYVPSIAAGTVSALDLEENRVAWTLRVSEGTEEREAESAMGIAATRDGKLVFTGDVATGEVVVVDAERREVRKRIPVGHQVHAIDIGPHDRWVVAAGRHQDYDWLSQTTFIDVGDLEKVETISPALGNAAHFAFTPDGEELWAASISTNLVWVIDVSSRRLESVVPLAAGEIGGGGPEAEMGLIGFNEVAISPDGSRAFVVGPAAGVIFAIDVPSREVVERVRVGERVHGVSVTRDGRQVWTANNAGTVTILDARSLEVVGEVDMRDRVDELTFAHIGFSPDGSRAYVSWKQEVSVIDVSGQTVIGSIPVEDSPHEISLEDYYVRPPGPAPDAAPPPSPEGAESGSSASPAAERRQVSNRAGIEVAATLKDEGVWEREEIEQLSFDVSLSTHAGDLMEEEIAEQTALWIDGEEVKADFEWDPESETSHHRAGTLRVSLDRAPERSIELVLRGVGVPERRFGWSAPGR